MLPRLLVVSMVVLDIDVDLYVLSQVVVVGIKRAYDLGIRSASSTQKAEINIFENRCSYKPFVTMKEFHNLNKIIGFILYLKP